LPTSAMPNGEFSPSMKTERVSATPSPSAARREAQGCQRQDCQRATMHDDAAARRHCYVATRHPA
jgi:hypothetical protein